MIKKHLFAGVFLLILSFQEAYADTPSPQPVVKLSFSEAKANGSFPITLLHLSDFPKNKEISGIIRRPLLKKELRIEQFRVNDEGKIIHPNQNDREELRISAQGFLPGERVEAVFQTVAGDALATASFIPYPIRAKTSDGHLVVTAELIMLEPANYKLLIEGLQEGEMFIFRSESENESFKRAISYQPNNPLAIMPGVLGKFGGIGLASITANSKTVTVRLPWGSDLMAYAKSKG